MLTHGPGNYLNREGYRGLRSSPMLYGRVDVSELLYRGCVSEVLCIALQSKIGGYIPESPATRRTYASDVTSLQCAQKL